MEPEIALMYRHFRANGEAHPESGLDAPPHGDKVRHCTKMVCMVAGGAEQLPWAVRVAIGQGNGKPFMVNRTGFFTHREGSGSFEIGVNAHNFGPVATNGQGLTLIKFSAQPEHFLRSFVTETSQLIPQKVLKLS